MATSNVVAPRKIDIVNDDIVIVLLCISIEGSCCTGLVLKLTLVMEIQVVIKLKLWIYVDIANSDFCGRGVVITQVRACVSQILNLICTTDLQTSVS